MKNLLLTIGVFAVGYTLYKEWMKNEKAKQKMVEVKNVASDVINKAVNSVSSQLPQTNSETFGSMKGVFDADISRTVAPSVNAKIGIF